MSEPEGTCAGALGGQVALVTGAGRGIGAATAHRLATDGASVAVVDLHEDDTADTVARIRDDGGTAIGIGCDVAASDQVEAAVERGVADLGGLHILGFVATAMTDATARRLGTSPERYRGAVADTVPLRRIGSPEDVAGVIAFLVGPTPPTSPARRSSSTAAVSADGVTWVAPACHPGDLWREGHVSPRWQALRGRHMMAVGGAMAAPGGRGGRRTEANA